MPINIRKRPRYELVVYFSFRRIMPRNAEKIMLVFEMILIVETSVTLNALKLNTVDSAKTITEKKTSTHGRKVNGIWKLTNRSGIENNA